MYMSFMIGWQESQTGLVIFTNARCGQALYTELVENCIGLA